MLCRAGGGGQASAKDVNAPSQLQDDDIPAELWKGEEGLRSFMQVPIGTAASPLGVLLLAKSGAGSFTGNW